MAALLIRPDVPANEQSWSAVTGQFAKLGSPLLKDNRQDGTEEAILS